MKKEKLGQNEGGKKNNQDDIKSRPIPTHTHVYVYIFFNLK